jgi:hypothetical protein
MMDNISLSVSETKRRLRHKRKRNLTAALGGVILCFALIGIGICLYTVIGFGIKTAAEYASPKETAKYYETYLSLVVGMDPQPYSKPKDANSDWMLKTALWATVSDDTNGSYAYTSDGRKNVPTSDIVKNYEKYFGDKTEPFYHTFTDNGITFEYNSTLKCFYLPTNAIIYVFTPKVSHIEKNGNTVTLTVQYLPKSGWTKKNDGILVAPAPTKTMIYVLKGGNGSYVIDAIKNLPSVQAQSSVSSHS